MRENENMVSLYRSTHKGLKTQVRYKRSEGQISLKQKDFASEKKKQLYGRGQDSSNDWWRNLDLRHEETSGTAAAAEKNKCRLATGWENLLKRVQNEPKFTAATLFWPFQFMLSWPLHQSPAAKPFGTTMSHWNICNWTQFESAWPS